MSKIKVGKLKKVANVEKLFVTDGKRTHNLNSLPDKWNDREIISMDDYDDGSVEITVEPSKKKKGKKKKKKDHPLKDIDEAISALSDGKIEEDRDPIRENAPKTFDERRRDRNRRNNNDESFKDHVNERRRQREQRERDLRRNRAERNRAENQNTNTRPETKPVEFDKEEIKEIQAAIGKPEKKEITTTKDTLKE